MKKFYAVLWILAVILFLVFRFVLNKPLVPPIENVPPAENKGDIVVYQSAEHGFSFSYPASAQLREATFEGFLPVTGNGVAGVFLDEKLFEGSNLAEAAFIAGVGTSTSVLAGCEKVREGETQGESLRINGADFSVFIFTGAAAGNLYESKSYRKNTAGTCYEIVLMLHSGNIGNYPEGTVQEFDRPKFAGLLEAIAQTFKFDKIE